MKFHLKKRFNSNLYKLMAINPGVSSKLIDTFVNKKRKNQIYCVGLPRSGTHSLAHLFGTHFCSKHEPLSGPTVKFCMGVANNKVSNSEVEKVLKMRDLFLNLEVEAAHYLFIFVPYLADLFPDAKFILTVREPRSWLNSKINMNLKTAGDGFWDEYQQIKYGKYSYPYQSDYLECNKYLYPISNYLKYYKNHIKTVIDYVPKNRLLIVDTFSISKELERIASFAKVSLNQLNLEKQHVSKGKKLIQIEQFVVKDIITHKIQTQCESFINEYVPFLRQHMGYLNE
jgi:translation initiation factor 2 beta subunit (eIF-2beta)/eIF-5